MDAPVVDHPAPHRWTSNQFIALADAGAFADLGRTELIEGEIYVLSPLYRPHAFNHLELGTTIKNALRGREDGLNALAAPSVELGSDSVPEPDLVIVAGDLTAKRALTVDMVRIAIEISDSTLAFDYARKGRLYARHGVPEYWVVDLEARVVHQLWSPTGDLFGHQRIVPFGTPIVAATVDDLEVATDGLR